MTLPLSLAGTLSKIWSERFLNGPLARRQGLKFPVETCQARKRERALGFSGRPKAHSALAGAAAFEARFAGALRAAFFAAGAFETLFARAVVFVFVAVVFFAGVFFAAVLDVAAFFAAMLFPSLGLVV